MTAGKEKLDTITVFTFTGKDELPSTANIFQEMLMNKFLKFFLNVSFPDILKCRKAPVTIADAFTASN